MLITIILTIVTFISFGLIVKKAGLAFAGKGAHPLGVFIAMQICIFSMPGVIMVSFIGWDSERYIGINSSTMFEIGMWYIYSIAVIFFILFMTICIFKPFNYRKALLDIYYLDRHWKCCKVIVFASLIFLILQVSLFAKPPLLYLLSGQIDQAYIARISMQNDPSSYYPPFVRTFLVFFTIFQSYYVFYIYNRLEYKKLSIYLVMILSVILAIFQSLYEVQKAPLIYLMIGLLFIRYIHKPKIIVNIFYALGIVALVIFLVSYVLGVDLNSAVDGALDRTFLGQNQGFYNIIQHIHPDPKYWFQDLYFAGTLGLNPSRADVDVIPYIYGDRDDIVNVNSYFLGQAWSMFGEVGLIISPIIVGAAISLYIIVLDRLIKIDNTLFIPFMIFFIPSIMLNQSFTYFLYGKYFLLSLINVFVFYMIIKISGRLTLKKKGKL